MKNVHFAIPEIYGDSLSYYELLSKLVKEMNTVIENYNTIPDQIDEEVKNLDASQLFSAVLNQLIHSIATDNTKSSNAVKVYKKHDLLYATFNETVNLYESLIDFSTGTSNELIPGTNIREVNISELFIELRKLIDINKNNITAIENKNTEQDNELNTLRTMLSSPYNFKGEVSSISALPASGAVNDTYYVQDVKYKVTWTGSAWVQSSLSEADYQTELSELKGDLSELEEDVETYKTFNISNAPSYFEVTKRENSNADASSGRVILGDLNGYTSYYFNIKKNCKICLLESGLADYTAIVIGSNPTGNWETVGASYRIQCTSSVRYRTSESNLPTLENLISVSKDDVIAITVKGGTNNAKIVLTDTETGLNHSLNLDGCANKISMVSNGYIHVKTENNVMYLHIPTDVENKFLQYKFFHYSLSANKADGWVLSKVVLCTKVGEEYVIDYPVVYDGEWELAIKLHGRPDYIGCRMHGSEITTYYKFYVDGKPYAFGSGHDFTCNEFRTVQKSTMYDPNDEVTIVGYHYWHHIITPKDIKIEQRVEWIADCQVDRSYTGMLPIARGNDDITSVQVTDRAYDTITFEEYDVSTGGFDNYMHDVVSGRDMYYIYGSESGVNATMKCTYKTAPIEKCGYIQNTINDYNKLYLAYCNDGASVSNGDVWEWVTEYTLNVADIN